MSGQSEFLYFYAWKPKGKYKDFYKKKMKVIARGNMNSALVEFQNGERAIISRNAIRKRKKD